MRTAHDPPPKRQLKVDLDEVAFAMESRGFEITSYLDLETGEVIPVTQDARTYAEEILAQVGTDAGSAAVARAIMEHDMPDWERDLVVEAIAVELGFGERFITIPASDSSAGYEDMESFTETVRAEGLQARLLDAIQGARPFRRFKDAIAQCPEERERWFAFSNERQRQRVIAWLADEGIEPA